MASLPLESLLYLHYFCHIDLCCPSKQTKHATLSSIYIEDIHLERRKDYMHTERKRDLNTHTKMDKQTDGQETHTDDRQTDTQTDNGVSK